MFGKWKLGELSGIGVYVHWSFWLLPAWILLSALDSSGGMTSAVVSVAFLFAMFACVVMHEFGHAFAARYFRIGTRDITLYPIGGVARLDRIPRNPWHELAIAVAGPAVNVVLAAVLLVVLALGFGASSALAIGPFGVSFLTGLLAVNVVLVLFNMIPAFPMDGGRVLRAFLAMSLPYARATEIASKVGQGIAVVLGIVALLSFQWTLLLVAIFVYFVAGAEAAMVRMQQAYTDPRPFTPFDQAVHSGNSESVSSGEGIIWTTEVRSLDPQTGTVRVIRYR